MQHKYQSLFELFDNFYWILNKKLLNIRNFWCVLDLIFNAIETVTYLNSIYDFIYPYQMI